MHAAVLRLEHVQEQMAALKVEVDSQKAALAAADVKYWAARDEAKGHIASVSDAQNDAIAFKDKAESRAASAERLAKEEAERRHKVEAEYKDLEIELARVKADGLEPAKELNDSATGKVKQATEEVPTPVNAMESTRESEQDRAVCLLAHWFGSNIPWPWCRCASGRPR
jgi:hypothetical protein